MVSYKPFFPASPAAWAAFLPSFGQGKMSRHGDSEVALDFLIKGSTFGCSALSLFPTSEQSRCLQCSGHEAVKCRPDGITEGQPHHHPSIELQRVAASLLKPYQKRKRKAYLFNALLPEVKHAWFDSTESRLADRRPFPTGVALPDQEELWLSTHTTRKQRIRLPSCRWRSCHTMQTNQEPSWSPNLMFIFHLPSQPDSLNLPSTTCCHFFLRSFMTVWVGCSCSMIIIMIQVPYILIIVQGPEERFPGLSEQEMKLYRQYDGSYKSSN